MLGLSLISFSGSLFTCVIEYDRLQYNYRVTVVSYLHTSALLLHLPPRSTLYIHHFCVELQCQSVDVHLSVGSSPFCCSSFLLLLLIAFLFFAIVTYKSFLFSSLHFGVPRPSLSYIPVYHHTPPPAERWREVCGCEIGIQYFPS